MTRAALLYTLATVVAALVVGAAGSLMTEGAGREGVWTGVAAAAGVQVLVFWLFFVWLLPHRKMLAHGVGVVGRLLAVGAMALLWVPRLAVPLGPTLFALVTVFFVTTVFEPLFLKPDLLTRR